MKKAILLISILIMFSCEAAPVASLQDGSQCPPCSICKLESVPESASACNAQQVEKCIEICIPKNKCFFWGRTCIKNCAYGCLDSLGCNWRD